MWLLSKKRYKIHTTAFDKKGRVICKGQNEYIKSNPWQKHLSIKAGLSEERVFCHSEVKTLLIAKNLKKKVHTLKVERYDCNGNPRLAMPCPSCMIAIHLTGVKRVIFTSEDGWKELYIQ